MGCCNGVVCLICPILTSGLGFLLWNPATRVFIKLPKLECNIYSRFGFGWDESNGAFKIVFATTTVKEDDSYKTKGHVYSSKTNSWKTVLLPRVERNDYLFNFGVFVCGRIHWVLQLYDEKYVTIVSFNLENDEFERIELPPPFNANATDEGGDLAPDTWLGEIGGCLCTLFHDNKKKRIDVLVMKEYGAKDSWFKLHTFPIADVRLSEMNAITPVFGECGLNGEIFITCCDKLMVYSPKVGDFSKVADLDPYRALVYVESLVSPLRITSRRSVN